jgi:hypothetical protein
MNDKVWAKLARAYKGGDFSAFSLCYDAGIPAGPERDAVHRTLLVELAGLVKAEVHLDYIRRHASVAVPGTFWAGYANMAALGTVPTWESGVNAWIKGGATADEATRNFRQHLQDLISIHLTVGEIKRFFASKTATATRAEKAAAAEEKARALGELFGNHLEKAKGRAKVNEY